MPRVRATSVEPSLARDNGGQGYAQIEERPKVLVVATDIPWPLDSGWRIRAFENIRTLGAFADVTLVCFCESVDPSADVAALRQALRGVRVEDPVYHRIHIKEQPFRLAQALARGLVTGRPYKVAKFASREMSQRLQAVPELGDFSVLHVELATLQYADMLRRRLGDHRLPVVLDTHNVESQLLADHCDRGEFGRLGPAVRVEAIRTRHYEASACSRADLVLAISDEDAVALRELGGPSAIVVTLPPVAEIASLPAAAPESLRPCVLFVGQLSWLPNQEAVRWLCEKVMPLLRAQDETIEVVIVGGGAPPQLVESIADSGAVLLGYVVDLAEVYARARVYVSPFLTGGGVRIKLLEAMRFGIPIVSTTTGAKGLEATPGQQIVLADTPDEFADAVARLLQDSETAERIADSAREYLQANHSREAVTQVMRNAYSRVAMISEALGTPEPRVPLEGEMATAEQGGRL